MRLAILLLLACSFGAAAQKPDPAIQLIWAFPITGYIVPIGDTVDVVQVELPQYLSFVDGKQLGLLRGIAHGQDVDTGSKGYGKCHLIKGQFNYFAIHMAGKSKPQEGDLLYTFIPLPKTVVSNLMLQCAAHAIVFTDVHDSALYKPIVMLKKWDDKSEAALLQNMSKDIQYVGNFYLKEGDTSMNKPIGEGTYKGKGILDAMTLTSPNDVKDFLGYVAARPRRYAGNRWKISETYATWMLHGSPKAIKE